MPTASPISRITELIDESTRMRWLSSAVSPSAAATAVMPSSSGIPAADERAEGEDAGSRASPAASVTSARWKSCWMRFVIAWLALASPNSPTKSPGWAACTAAAAASAGADAILRGVGIARDLERHQRRGAVLGALPLVAALQRRRDARHRRDAGQARPRAPRRRRGTALPAADRCGSGSAPARPRARSGTRRPSTWLAANDSPLPQSACLSVTVPAAEPSA